MCSDESHFNVSLTVRDKVTRQCPQSTISEEKGEPERIRTNVPLLTSLTGSLISAYQSHGPIGPWLVHSRSYHIGFQSFTLLPQWIPMRNSCLQVHSLRSYRNGLRWGIFSSTCSFTLSFSPHTGKARDSQIHRCRPGWIWEFLSCQFTHASTMMDFNEEFFPYQSTSLTLLPRWGSMRNSFPVSTF